MGQADAVGPTSIEDIFLVTIIIGVGFILCVVILIAYRNCY